MENIVGLFAGNDKTFGDTIISIFQYERIAAVMLAVTSAVMGMLYGFGYTKLALLINVMQLFVFRIPTLYFLMNYSELGSESVGIAMMVSNIMVGFTAIVIALFVIRNVKSQQVEKNELLHAT